MKLTKASLLTIGLIIYEAINMDLLSLSEKSDVFASPTERHLSGLNASVKSATVTFHIF